MSWQDYSDYIVHFTKGGRDGGGYYNSLSICHSLKILAKRSYGIGRRLAPTGVLHKTVCFSEAPLHCLMRICEGRSPYGIVFSKSFAISNGAIPIWYVENNTDQYKALQDLMLDAKQSDCPESSPIWKLTPFIDAPGDYHKGSYRFEWEREWRCLGDFHFSPENVSFLIIPEEFHSKARDFFKNARLENTGPSFECPFIDSSWDEARVSQALQISIPAK